MSADSLISLNEEIRACRKCPLGSTRANAVPGEGNKSARVMFVGEAPGATEDTQGVPFCGKAGGVLDDLLAVSGLKRTDVFIANILKCRPPGNRNPNQDEIVTCTPYLDRQIDIIRPSVLCCLGNFACGYLLRKFGLAAKVQGITKIHGNIFIADAAYGKVKIIPLFHPAVVTYDQTKLPILKKDFLQLKYVPKD
ncbi:MAG: uracil-DNA glycosylase [Candidatus Omnitrophica bacterium]|nr:uracil-DNA glycosylase [Candidatus Omnitrophota bacterium]